MTNYETAARNTLLWRVPGLAYEPGFTTRIVEMLDLFPTLVELAGLPSLPACVGDPGPEVDCVEGVSYASAFGVGAAAAREFAIHQWPCEQETCFSSALIVNVDCPLRRRLELQIRPHAAPEVADHGVRDTHRPLPRDIQRSLRYTEVRTTLVAGLSCFAAALRLLRGCSRD